MSIHNSIFAWKDRDTAALDMLALVHHGPPSVRMTALELLSSLHSSVGFETLEPIVFDETRDIWERRYALRAIASSPGDVYLPQFARLVSACDDWFDFHFDDWLSLASQNPSNLDWVFNGIERLMPQEYLQKLNSAAIFLWTGIDLTPLLSQRMKTCLEEHLELLNVEIISTLRVYDGSETTLKWLRQRWNELIYLCVGGDKHEVFSLLENWDDLRAAVFENCPAMIAEYEAIRSEVEVVRQQHNRLVDYQSSPLWQELNGLYLAASEGSTEAFLKLRQFVYHERHNLSKRAVATHLLSKLKDQYEVLPALLHALRYAPDDAPNQQRSMNAPVRYEAGEALVSIISPDVWETMIDVLFARPSNDLDHFLLDWIEYLTHRLSGLDVSYEGSRMPDENRRYWFHALVEPGTKDTGTEA